MLGELSLYPPTGDPVFNCSFICLDAPPSLHLPLLWLLSQGGSKGLCPAVITGWTFRLTAGWQWATAPYLFAGGPTGATASALVSFGHSLGVASHIWAPAGLVKVPGGPASGDQR